MSRPLIRLSFWAFVAMSCLTSLQAQKCLSGVHHHKTPQAGSQNFTGICSAHKEKTCCKDTTARSVHQRFSVELHLLHHDDCGPLSEACQAYHKAEMCFYECSPYTEPWGNSFGDFEHLPICADTCDAWYEACKNDHTCTPDLLEAVIKANGSEYHCPGYKTKNLMCRTYAETYGSGKKLCETIWGTSFLYTVSSNKAFNCMRFPALDGRPNANACVTPNGSSSPVDAKDCATYRLSLSSADRLSEAIPLFWLLSSLLLLAACQG